MRIDKAIEELNDCMSETHKILYPECLEAHQLGIEALKRIKNDRFIAHPYCLSPLPGETED